MSDATSTLHWIPVAFVRQTSGRLHVLFSLDRDATPLHDGDPVLLVDHRPGEDAADLTFEPADVLDDAVVAGLDANRAEFATCLAGAFTRDGSFDADQLLAQRIRATLVS